MRLWPVKMVEQPQFLGERAETSGWKHWFFQLVVLLVWWHLSWNFLVGLHLCICTCLHSCRAHVASHSPNPWLLPGPEGKLFCYARLCSHQKNSRTRWNHRYLHEFASIFHWILPHAQCWKMMEHVQCIPTFCFFDKIMVWALNQFIKTQSENDRGTYQKGRCKSRLDPAPRYEFSRCRNVPPFPTGNGCVQKLGMPRESSKWPCQWLKWWSNMIKHVIFGVV